MIVELVASRMTSKYLGSSLFTWTSVIGIVLGGASLGNWLGGRMADRWDPRKLLPILLLVSSFLTILIIALDIAVGRLTWTLGMDGMTARLLAITVALVAILFLLPSCALGTISPVVVKRGLAQSTGVGRTVGGIYAAGSLGGIGGTFLAGFLLIPLFGLTMNILLVGILLALLSLFMGGRRIVSGAWAAALAVLALTGAPGAAARSFAEAPAKGNSIVFEKDSPYSYIRVTDSAKPGGTERTLRLDALIHNKVDPRRPDALLYEYERMFESLTRAQAGNEGAGDTGYAAGFSTLTLGGGGFTFPEYLERHYPEGRHTVVEIDPEVVATAHAYFDLPVRSELRIVIGDARTYVDAVQARDLAAPRARFDIIYCDAFNAFSVPSHLTTREFTASVAALLMPGGLYLVNCIDILDSGRFLNAFLNTVKSVFPRVSVYVSPLSDRSQRATFVIAAGGRRPLPDVLLSPEGEAVGIRFSPADLAELRRRNGSGVLTDDHAPVDTLMAPVFLRAVR
jgi:MFS family permease